MPRLISFLAIAMSVLVLSRCGAGVREVEGIGYVGMILNHPCEEDVRPWVPAPEDVADFEQRLPGLIESDDRFAATPLRSTVTRYRRRYNGQQSAGSKILCVTFIHEDSQAVKSGRWRTGNRFAIVGGGYRVWSMKFDTSRKAILDVEFQADE